MKILGLSCGSDGGNAEILLIEALEAAAKEHEVDVELLRLNDVSLPEGAGAHNDFALRDDAEWLWTKLLECDALIVSTPIYTRSIPGQLKMLSDRILGPEADMAFMQESRKLQAQGDPHGSVFRVDERLFKNRVGAFITLGGSTTPEWKTLALPSLHCMTMSMQIGIVDAIQHSGDGLPGSVTLDDDFLERARQVGRNVAGQLGRDFASVEYKGDTNDICPSCHLDVFVLRDGGAECAVCGVRGKFVLDEGVLRVEITDEELSTRSLLGLEARRVHFWETQDVSDELVPQIEEIRRRAAAYNDYAHRIRPIESASGAA